MSKNESQLPTLFLISGPWGSGTSALAGCIYHLGLPIPSPFYFSSDERTLNTFETQEIRSILKLLCKEKSLKKINNEKLI